MKTHLVYNVGRLRRYVDSQKFINVHQSIATDGDVDRESSAVAEEATRYTGRFSVSSDPPLVKEGRRMRMTLCVT